MLLSQKISSLVLPNPLIRVKHARILTMPLLTLNFAVTIVFLSRLAYRKGIDLLVATAPRICATFPNVRFVIGTLYFVCSEGNIITPPIHRR